MEIEDIVKEGASCCESVKIIMGLGKELCLSCLLSMLRGGSFDAERIKSMQDVGMFDQTVDAHTRNLRYYKYLTSRILPIIESSYGKKFSDKAFEVMEKLVFDEMQKEFQ